jgi:hypothetical protein
MNNTEKQKLLNEVCCRLVFAFLTTVCKLKVYKAFKAQLLLYCTTYIAIIQAFAFPPIVFVSHTVLRLTTHTALTECLLLCVLSVFTLR